MEAMPFSCDTSNWPTGSNSSTALYALDHNPFTYYSSTRTTAACQNNIPVRSLGDHPCPAEPPGPFANDMSGGSLPNSCSSLRTIAMRCTPMPGGGNNEPTTPTSGCLTISRRFRHRPGMRRAGSSSSPGTRRTTRSNSAWVNGGYARHWATAPFCGGNPVKTGGHVPTIVISAANATSTTHNYCAGGNLFGITRAIEEDYGVGLLSNTANAGNGDLLPAFGATSSGCIGGTVTDGTATGHPALAGVTATCSCQTGTAG